MPTQNLPKFTEDELNALIQIKALYKERFIEILAKCLNPSGDKFESIPTKIPTVRRLLLEGEDLPEIPELERPLERPFREGVWPNPLHPGGIGGEASFLCYYCDPTARNHYDPETACGERAENGMSCTREKGHIGKHVACGSLQNAHPLLTWN